ncbi:La-related protein 7 like protein [Argiope bruennichi]|uniref:La-related protein 7 like protein n=1 Tax=Argiope bruennichi TaxID=94029 RepID=A0A8T0FCV0_ARGBR|nr:La-related protein 7 like protein [Argiope bruennichi]
MEFYFSDSNLARDNYLQDLLTKNPEGYVDLEVFKSFNKIKEMTDDVNAIIAALSKSTVLQFYKKSSGKENTESDDQCTESKSNLDESQKNETCPDKERKARKRKMSSDADEPPHKLEAANSENEGGKIKKKRKHKKKGHHNSEKPVLRVMSKHEWKAYRNKYLNLQRSTMSFLKKQIMMEAQELKEQDPVDEKPDNETSNKGLHFQPGVIIKITLKDSITDLSNFKEKVKAAAHVAYIDAQLGHSEMFIRCHTPEEANFIIQEKKFDSFGTVSLLEGTEEQSYWTKIQEDRKAKFSLPLVRKKRGRDKKA